MKQKLLRWLVIGVGVLAVGLIWTSLEWRASPSVAVAQDSFEENPKPSGDAQELSNDATQPEDELPRRLRNKQPPVGVGGAAGFPGGGKRGMGISTAGKRMRTIVRQLPIVENGVTRFVEERIVVEELNADKKQELNAAIRAAVQNYQTTEDEKARHDIEASLSKSLGELFDLQQSEREEQLKPMEERVKKLRETLNKRAKLREDLILLRGRVLLQDAEGLGWGTDDEFLPGVGSTIEPPANDDLGGGFGGAIRSSQPIPTYESTPSVPARRRLQDGDDAGPVRPPMRSPK